MKKETPSSGHQSAIVKDGGRTLRPLLLGVALGALAVAFIAWPKGPPLPSWITAPTSSPSIQEGLPAPADVWAPDELKQDPKWNLLRYDADGWTTDYVGTYKRLDRFLVERAEGVDQLAIPLFPTVYVPDINDKVYYDWIDEGDIAPGDKVLVIGTGSGADSWAVSRKTQSKVYAVDINPLAVINARVTARLGGFELEAVVGDFQEVELPEDFRDFDWVLWNMPFVEVGATDLDFEKRNFHDGDDGSVATRFLERLPSLLKPEGKAVALNYALARNYLTTPGTTTHVADSDEPVTNITYMLFVIPNPATAEAPAEGAASE